MKHTRLLSTLSLVMFLAVSLGFFPPTSPQTASAQVPDEATLRQAGIRTLRSHHLTLHTDLPSSPDVDELPRVFDLAIPQWTEFFQANAGQLDDWHVTACVMRDGQRFEDYRLQPAHLPPFLHGMQRGNQVWVREQTSVYYRRHLLLHEGTHAVMNQIYGRVGPVWYREGIADLLATHVYRDGKLQLNVFPKDRRDLENSGRIQVIRDAVSQQGTLPIPEIVALPTRAYLNIEAYAWSWALQSFLHQQPPYAPLRQSLLRKMLTSDHGVTDAFLQNYQQSRRQLDLEWNLFVQHLDYGYDASHETITPADQLADLHDDQTYTVVVDAAKGWQSTGIRLPAGATLHVAAHGRFQVAEEIPTSVAENTPPVAWMCEPQGVTIEYYQGRPLGQLLAAIVSDSVQGQDASVAPASIGRRGKLFTKTGGELYFRVNERADRLVDNQGQITVKLRRATE